MSNSGPELPASRICARATILAIGLGVVAFGVVIGAPSSAMEQIPKIVTLNTAQAAEPGSKGKSDDTKGKATPSTPQSTPAPKSPSSTMQNAPKEGVPARCASIADAAERQKCMNTPKGQ
jgi:hypothetical protein